MVTGHPFKGGMPMSTGYLNHPEMKFFKHNDATLYVPPNPLVWATAFGVGAGVSHATIPSFGDFFGTYFAGRSFNVTEPKCTSMLEGLKKCYENHSAKAPVETCQYYIQGFERMACGKV